MNIYKNKKVLITGHTGFKGSWLASWLQLLGADVVGIALSPHTTPSHFRLLNLDMESHISDIRDYEKLSKLIHQIKPEILFHLAAQAVITDSYAKPLYTLETNVLGTTHVLEACRGVDSLKAIVIITSDKCYRNDGLLRGCRETDPLGGYDPYSASKGCAELVATTFRNSFFNPNKFGKTHQILVATARSVNVIGGGDWAKDRLVPDIIRSIIENKKLHIRKPDAIRSWQHVLDALYGYLCLGEKLLKGEKQFADAWNFSSSTNTITVLDMIQRIYNQWPTFQYEIIPPDIPPLHETTLLTLDASKAHKYLNWKAQWDIDTTLSITVEWYRTFYENKKLITLDTIERYSNDLNSIKATEQKEHQHEMY